MVLVCRKHWFYVLNANALFVDVLNVSIRITVVYVGIKAQSILDFWWQKAINTRQQK